MNTRAGLGLLFTICAGTLLLSPAAQASGELPPGGHEYYWLDRWSFTDTNAYTSDLEHAPLSFTNLADSYFGNWHTLVLDNPDPAWLRYKIVEDGGATNLTLDAGTILFWFAPNWASTNAGGTGPGTWSRLIEVGSYTTNASHGWWSLYTDPEGANLYFASQTNDGSGAVYLSAPVSWASNYWKMLTLTYTSSNTALYLDGELITNGPGVSYLPPADVLTNGFNIGSAIDGSAQAHGMFDDLRTYAEAFDSDTVAAVVWYESVFYWANVFNPANISSAPSEPAVTPSFNAVTGSGYLVPLTNAVACVTNSRVWITNVAATLTANGVNLSFAIAGGSNAVPYDVFANSVLDLSGSTNRPWAWMGQGLHCASYMLTNLPFGTVFVILGTPQDSDSDGLTDAYELLVSKTDPSIADTDRDGMTDGQEVQLKTDPLHDDAAQYSSRVNFTYDLDGWLNVVAGGRSESAVLDREGNVKRNSQ